MEITQEQLKKIKELAHKHELKLVLLFGSQVAGLTHKQSDVDIAVLGHHMLVSSRERFDLEEAFKHIFNRADVEVVDLRTSPPLLQRNATSEGRILYEEHEGDFANFQIFAMKHFMEMKPLRDIMNERLREFARNA